MAVSCKRSLIAVRTILGLFLLTAMIIAQIEPREGLREKTPGVHALTGATIIPAPGQQITNGTIIIRDGLISAVGANVKIPPEARVWDYTDVYVYAGLIDMYVKISAQKGEKAAAEVDVDGHWSPRITPQRRHAGLNGVDKKFIAEAHKSGFTSAYIVPDNGIFRGSGTVVSLRKEPGEHLILKDNVAQHVAFDNSNAGKLGYPNSLMGAIALIRQTLYDAHWYNEAANAYRKNSLQAKPASNQALAALQDVIASRVPTIFEVTDDLNLRRAAEIAGNFELSLQLRGSGHEYRQVDFLKALKAPLIIPVNFPDDLELATIEDGLEVDLRTLQHWEIAPENPRILEENNLRFAFTRDGLDKKTDLFDQLRLAIKRGLSEKTALAALTTHPATFLGLQEELGRIKNGAMAHLIVTDKPLFDKKRRTMHVWVDGQPTELHSLQAEDPAGKWQVKLDDRDILLSLSGSAGKLTGELKTDEKKVKLSRVHLDSKLLTITFKGDSLDLPGVIRLSATIDGNKIDGRGQYADGAYFDWSATRSADDEEQKPESKADEAVVEQADYGKYQGAFAHNGVQVRPAVVLVKNATIWTSGPSGILENSDLLIKNGEIEAVGNNLNAPSNAMVIDATGKHVTPGLIDAHSHSAISGSVNESQQAVTAEVSIGDVVDNYDIAIYRELAGGLTTANLLHGSANPIGGQNAVIKLRWGKDAQAMKLQAAPPGIKFALGENVKQSNWGDNFTKRYPQTRMGVETLIRDRFLAAVEYRSAWQEYRHSGRKKNKIPPRIDLELEILVEILDGKRLVHSHSYRQDEIQMLCRLAEEFGFTIATFQHVLEGYKVAEELARLNFGASTFSDWWAYKFEVYDAIPFNGALMHDVGVVVSFNSDSDELARRMNTEAAKAVKYGGVSPEEALKFVTINPAKQLRIDGQTGSLEVGKDADFVVWNGDPLSTYSMCEQTWIDGVRYFDRQQDLQARKTVVAERARLVQKYLSSKEGK